ncbi:MAG: glycosyltransferase family 4 protein [Deltaproteobacteria bacterium]|nr:glycosyltransferase family 4 protein [Deltaproteobacteria bacterium]
MKPRRILYVTRVVEGGLAIVVDQLARGLDRDRYEPVVLFDTARQSIIRKGLSESDIKTIDLKKCEEEQASASPLPRKNRDIGGRVETCFGKRAHRFYFSLKAFREFLLQQAPRIALFVRTIKENDIDLVHTHHSLKIGKPEIIASWLTGVPCISHRHGYSNVTHFDKFFARFLDSVIYVSRDIAQYHIVRGEQQAIGTIIHNGVDLSEFTRPYNVVQVRSEFGCKSDEPLVGIIGRIDWWKGHEYFLEAIASAARKFPDLKAIIIGEFEKEGAVNLNRKHTQKVKSLVKLLGIEDKILFTGFRSDVSRLISGLDVVVHASSEPEPFGLVVIEAMAAGKPVVATAAGGVLDIIENGVNGLLVPCKDSKAMARAIIKILSDRDKAGQIGNAARQRIFEKFTVQHQVTSVQNLYDSIL